jgi:ABC-type polysaccharide/polyol phosphate export permease
MFNNALSDFKEGLRNKEFWLFAAWMDTKQRYRRSVLGPFWISLSLAIFVLSIGILWSKLFNIEIESYLPYFCCGLLVWNFIAGIINESCALFTRSQGILKQIKLPLSVYAFNLVTRHFIIFLHNFIVFIAVAIWFKINFLTEIIYILPALVIYSFTAFWVSILVGIFCTRFRDIEQIIPAITQIIFFMTPIIWKMEFLGKKAYFLGANPFYHFVEILRAPLLGYNATLLNYGYVLAFTLIGFCATLALFNKYGHRIIYWL